MCNYLITGGSGFIGSFIVKKLLQLSSTTKIKIYDINPTISIEDSRIEIIKGDVLDKEKLIKNTCDVNVIIHCAAICGIDTIKKNPLKTIDINFKGTENVLECSKIHNIKKTILFSTSEVYGKYCIGYNEDCKVEVNPININERSIYQISKLLGETYGYIYHKMFGLDITVIRPFNIYGPGQIGEGAIKNFVDSAIKNENIYINGSGKIIRSWCYVDDIVDCVMKAIDKCHQYNIYNVGNSNNIISIKNLAIKIIKLAKSESKIIYREALMDDILIRFPCTEKAENQLNYTPLTNLEEGLKKTITYCKNN
jgi:nucleoside-diphosphate-sugar epimerase